MAVPATQDTLSKALTMGKSLTPEDPSVGAEAGERGTKMTTITFQQSEWKHFMRLSQNTDTLSNVCMLPPPLLPTQTPSDNNKEIRINPRNLFSYQ